MRASRPSVNAAFGRRRRFSAGPNGLRTTSGGSRGQSAVASRTLAIPFSAMKPGRGLTTCTLAPVNAPRVCAQSAILLVPTSPPQLASVVLAPASVTVPAILRTFTGSTRPLDSRTVTGKVVRKLTLRIPSDVSVRRQSPLVTGAAVKVHSWWSVPTIVSRNSVGAGAADACAATTHATPSGPSRRTFRRRGPRASHICAASREDQNTGVSFRRVAPVRVADQGKGFGETGRFPQND